MPTESKILEHLIYKVGYGRQAVENNIKVLMELDGLPEERAREAALKVARRVFQKKNPGRKLPAHLEE